MIGIPTLAALWRHLLPNLRLPAVATWTEADAELSPWRARHDGTARATVTLTLPDGTTRTATLPAAPLDLLGAITDSSTLWVGGTTGRVVVGFPGYPHTSPTPT
ncbi:hypothetical protein JOD54_002851 [Actinokineospora baliensis]|uniref:hypothetical protein n=1 Tax=Actinokineospora baliensis TaxID=547056 RepID=UPI00195E25EC|nr:hypothetical protein [Actinokineospora baliensis]MBM7772647.1 hypothetical protein [Actinokineospora baliensis]